MKAINIKIEYLEVAIGIDVTNPLISWHCADGLKQTAYQVVAKMGQEVIWDSGKVISSSMRTKFAGELQSRDIVDLEIKLWDENDKAGSISKTSFEMGLLEKRDFKGKWISGNYRVNRRKRYPVDYFKKLFNVRDVIKARIYVSACGIYEGMINGKRIGEYVLAPGSTDYRKRIQYQTYDVTSLINDGDNELVFLLADGWYRGSTGAWGIRNQYGTVTKLFVQLELTQKNGEFVTIVSDKDFAWSNDGPILLTDNKDGEVVDANKEPSFSNKAKRRRYKVVPTAANTVQILEHETFKPKLFKTPNGQQVLDFGQNISGYISFEITAKKGDVIKLYFGEMLDKNGEFTQENFQLKMFSKVTPLQRVIYTAKEGKNVYKTKFSTFGFQYVLVETNLKIKPEQFTAIAVYSAIKQVGEFDSSNELLNKFIKNTIWSTKSNSTDMITDCPTRERHGWTGDAQLFLNTATYLFDYNTHAKKYLRDVYDWQKRDGRLPMIAPYGGVDFYMAPMNGSTGWSDAGIIMPYILWKKYGDEQLIHNYYARIKRYARFVMRRVGRVTLLSERTHLKRKHRKHIINYGQSFGEWAEPANVHQNKWTNMVFPHPEVSTAYGHYVMQLMKEMAILVGNEKDAAIFQKYATNLKAGYQALRKTKRYTLDTNRQAKLVRPLYFNLLGEKEREYAKKRLIKAMDNYNWRVGTGFLSTPFILYVLGEIDLKYAYRLLENEEMPGWLYMPKMGATTIWESWEGTEAQDGIASLNHYSKGAAAEWVFSEMCGINVSGENSFIIAPKPGGTFKHASFTYESVYGIVSSKWTLINNEYTFIITVPANTKATIKLPNKMIYKVNAGTHQYQVSM